MAEKYYVNKQDLADYLTHFQTVDGGIGVPAMMQSDYMVPGRTGSVAADPWVGTRSVTIGGIIAGSSRWDYHNKLRAFSEVVFNDGRTFTLKRTLDDSASTSFTSVGTARYVGGLEQVEPLSDRVGRVAVSFSLMEGFFYDEAETDTGQISTAAFSVTVPGDATTHKVRVFFNNTASTQRLTNTTTDDWVQFAASTASNSAGLDVSAFTATQASNNVIQYVSANTTSYYWMRLRPGANSFTLTGGGTVRLFYKAAWL